MHTLGDAHLYSNHFDQVATQWARIPKALSVMKINPSVTDLFAFTFDDFTLQWYEADPSISASIAVLYDLNRLVQVGKRLYVVA